MTDGRTSGASDGRDAARDAGLAGLLREARVERFRPGFADRVMGAVVAGGDIGTRDIRTHRTGTRASRIESDLRAPAFASALTAQFLRLAPLAAALIAGLFVHNVWIAGSGRPTVDDALGLRPVTMGEAYSLEVLLRVGGSEETPE